MMMSRSEAQQTSSPLFREKVQEQQDNLKDTLPFDRCIRVDEEFEKDLENKEVLIDKREFLYELPNIKTTISKSKKDILSWVGIKNITLWVMDKFVKPAVGIGISITIFFLTALNSLGLSDELFSSVVAGALFAMLAAVAFFCSLGEEVSNVGYIYRKLDSEDYLISNRVVDCPTAIKLKLYEYIRFEEELYIKYVPQKQEVQFFTNEGKVSYYTLEKSADRNDIRYQWGYFASQLIPNKFYRISDIITDKAVKN
jgi:hypothetical protein